MKALCRKTSCVNAVPLTTLWLRFCVLVNITRLIKKIIFFESFSEKGTNYGYQVLNHEGKPYGMTPNIFSIWVKAKCMYLWSQSLDKI